ncbi:MAG: lysophospholipid acyltransferase family protein [Phycisphaeraceae bacterium]|nr:lysophospholipid acyltransferase family protein [Phycisphaeraceae bacterium]
MTMKVALASLGGRALMGLIGRSMSVAAAPYGWYDQFRMPVEKSGSGDEPGRSKPSRGGLIYALWHGPHFPVLWTYRGQGICVVASRSGDGEILARILESLGYQTVRGSSSRGGGQALVELARRLKSGQDVAVALDGPRGPRLQAKPGVVLLAKLTGCPIVPVAAGLSRYWEIHSWDHYRLPKPFAKARLVAGQTLTVPPDADENAIESIRAKLEESLRNLQEQVDQEMAVAGA